MTIPRGPLIGLAVIIALLAILWGVGALTARRGHQGEIQSAIHQGEAQAHVQAAQSIPDHSETIKRAEARADAAEARVARERAKVARLEQVLKTSSNPPIAHPTDDEIVAGDLLAAKDVLIDGLDGQVAELKAEVVTLKLALSDEQKRSAKFLAAYEAERKATAAQAAATAAWKQAVTAGKWRGRTEGFLAGLAFGYVGGRR